MWKGFIPMENTMIYASRRADGQQRTSRNVFHPRMWIRVCLEEPPLNNEKAMHLAVLSPLILPTDLLLLLRGEVIGDVERLPDLLGGLALDHVRNGLAANVKEGLDVEIVGSENDLEQHLLVDLHEFLVPFLNIGGLLAGIGVIIGSGWGVILVVLAPLNNLLEDRLIDVRNGDGRAHGSITKILNHVLDEHGALSDLAID
jgi:hypothetical protein